jgi:hypothetical protein
MFSARALSTVLAGTLLSGAAMAQSKEDKRSYVAIVVGLSS